MKVTYNWLKEFVEFDYNPEDLAEILNSLGMGIEETRKIAWGLENRLKVVEIEKVQKVKNKELYICEINDGKRKVTVISGAPNTKQGMLTVYAPPGTEIMGQVLGIREFDGIKSEGMLLSFDEIGVGEEREGLIELDKEFKIGEDPLPGMGLPDVVFDMEITPNRPDLLSVIGVAREIAAYKGVSFSPPSAEPDVNLEIPEFPVEIKDYDLCPRYTGRVIQNIRVKEAPVKIQVRLFLSGLRPINNVVDITNIVMLETGQPLHAFDLDKLQEKIIVRKAKQREKILCLDGAERELSGDILVIADAEKPVAIAGIIGGEETGVTENTKNIFLESAYFDNISIRKSRKKLKIDTESSYRFERKADWEGVLYASKRATCMLEEICGGTSGIITDVKKSEKKEVSVFLREDRVKKVLGEDINIKQAKEILENLGFKVKDQEGDKIFFYVPSFRRDIEAEEDLIEEIARHYGYEKIKGKIEKGVGFTGTRDKIRDKIREFFKNKGFYESISVTFVGEKDIELSGLPSEKFIPLKNPLSQRYSHLRRYIFISLLHSFSINVNRGRRLIKLFETGHVFGKNKDYEEVENLCVLMGGEVEKNIFEKERKIDFYDLKGILDDFLSSFNLEVTFKAENYPFLKIGFSIQKKDKTIGFAGILSERYNEFFDIPYEIEIFEIDLSAIKIKSPVFTELPKFPPLYRDLSFLSPRDTSYGVLEEKINNFKGEYLEKFYPIDVFYGKPLPEGIKNTTIRCVFRKKEGTLTEDEVEKEVQNLLKYIEENTPFKFRR